MKVDAMRKFAVALLFGAGVRSGRAKDTGLIFVSNEKTNNIIVIDPKTYKVVKDIKVSRRPRDMHFNADHSKLYVACGDDDVIDILDVAKLQGDRQAQDRAEPGSLRHGRETAAASTSPTRRARRSPSSTWIATPSCRKCRPAPSRKACWSARTARPSTSPPRPAIWCTRSTPTPAPVTRDVVAGLRPRRLAATPDGKELWVTAELSGEVDIIDRARFVVTGKIAFLAAGHAQSRRDAGRPHHDQRRQDRLRDARPRRPCRRRRRAGAQGLGLHPGRQDGRGASRCRATRRRSTSPTVSATTSPSSTPQDRKAKISVPVGRVPYGVVVDD